MKQPYLWLSFAFIMLSGSCSSLPFDSSVNSAWAAEGISEAKGTIRVSAVSAEKSGEWGALEKEIMGLLPLLFWEESYRVVSANEDADYLAEVNVREREYSSGWKTKRSLSVEIRLWAAGNNGPLPLSAGMTLNNGNKSLASSQTLVAMLRKAVKGAVGGLPDLALLPERKMASGSAL